MRRPIKGDFDGVKKYIESNTLAPNDLTRLLMTLADKPDVPAKTFEYILHCGADASTLVDGDTVAHVAARSKNLVLLSLLPVEAKLKPNSLGSTPLMEAVKADCPKCTKHLVHLFRQKFGKGSDWEQSFSLALGISQSEVLSNIIRQELRYLRNKCELTEKQRKDFESLKRIISRGDIKRLREASLALTSCADLADGSGKTLLMWAAENVRAGDQVIKFLTMVCDPTAADINGWTSLHFAAGKGLDHAVRIIVEAGAPVNCLDEKKLTPLMQAAVSNRVNVVKALIELGANWELCNKDGTALYQAKKGNHTKVTSILGRLQKASFFPKGGYKHCTASAKVADAATSCESGLNDAKAAKASYSVVVALNIVKLIARGIYAKVYLAKSENPTKKFCFKKVKLPYKPDEDKEKLRQKLLKAVTAEQNLCLLNHVNVIEFIEMTFNAENLSIHVTMDFAEGDTLCVFVAKHAKNCCLPSEERTVLDVSVIRNISRQICDALAYIHKKDIFHRDLHYKNIMINEQLNNQVKLIDFGLSIKLLHSVSHLYESSGMEKGMFNFLAPELFGINDDSKSLLSAKVDIWSFACNVFFMSTGKLPYNEIENLCAYSTKLASCGAQALPEFFPEDLINFYKSSSLSDRKMRLSASELLSHGFLLEDESIQDPGLGADVGGFGFEEDDSSSSTDKSDGETADAVYSPNGDIAIEDMAQHIAIESGMQRHTENKAKQEKRSGRKTAGKEVLQRETGDPAVQERDEDLDDPGATGVTHEFHTEDIKIRPRNSDIRDNYNMSNRDYQVSDGYKDCTPPFLIPDTNAAAADTRNIEKASLDKTKQSFSSQKKTQNGATGSGILNKNTAINNQEISTSGTFVTTEISIKHTKSNIDPNPIGQTSATSHECKANFANPAFPKKQKIRQPSPLNATGKIERFCRAEVTGGPESGALQRIKPKSKSANVLGRIPKKSRMASEGQPHPSAGLKASQRNRAEAAERRKRMDAEQQKKIQAGIKAQQQRQEKAENYRRSCLSNTIKDESKRRGRRNQAQRSHNSADEQGVFPYKDDATSIVGSAPYRKRWDITRFLGRGACGDVYEVVTDLNQKCAVKTVRLPVQRSAMDKFIEGEMNLTKLKHNNIVNVLWCQPRQPSSLQLVIFMELLHGSTLESLLCNKPLDFERLASFGLQICSALEYMHNQNPPVIHRDINCSNIMVLADSNKIKLIDFGLSIRLQETVTHCSASTMDPKGTYHFMAPEFLGAEDSRNACYSRESDIWAFGCTVYQMATGTRPHSECNNLLKLAVKLNTHGAPVLPNSCPPELQNFYACCVAKDRRDRKSAADLLNHEFLKTQRSVVGTVGESMKL